MAPATADEALVIADAELDARGLRSIVEHDRPLGPLTTYRVGGAAARFVLAETVDHLLAVAAAATAAALPVLVVGRGSNLLVADRGFAGIAVQLGPSFAAVDVDDCVVRAGAAALLPVVARRSAAAGCTGFEWAVGVPGSIGGAVRMNAGGHGSDMAAVLVDATVIELGNSGRIDRRTVAELHLGYRTSSVRAGDVVVAATLQLAAGDADAAARTIEEIVRWRRENQPGGQNAGSVFTNPTGDSAGRLIDSAGCKGLRVGTAHVSSKHANFIQADENGSADDVRSLMSLVRERVRSVHGIDLEPETHMVGFGEEST
jgi:UDP-N-acetylmuramate dehydrogenase